MIEGLVMPEAFLSLRQKYTITYLMRVEFPDGNPFWMCLDFAVHGGYNRKSDVSLRLRWMRLDFVVILCAVNSFCGQALRLAGHRLISEDVR
jgi:hypothetical protein